MAIPLAVLVGWSLAAPPEAPPDPIELQTAAVAAPEPAHSWPLTIKTTRRGNHHIMHATIVGRGSKRMVMPLLVDTGASVMALPASMMAKLGLDATDLEDRLVDTANGRILVKAGRLASVEIGGPSGSELIRNVDAVFIADASLGHALLGMNVLGRYRVTLDDERDQIVLERKK